MKPLSNRIQIQKKSVITNWKLRAFYLITREDQKETNKVTKALLVKCAPNTDQRNCNGSQQQMFVNNTDHTEFFDQWFGNISNSEKFAASWLL